MEEARRGGAFAQEGEFGFGERGGGIDETADMLRRMARGEESFSAEQLRQGLQQNLSAQQSLAAGARPANAAMAARTAAIQSGRLGSGLAGQQALAGIAERQGATTALGDLLMGARGQDLQAALGGRGLALGGYGDVLDAATQLKLGKMQQPSRWERALAAAMGGVQAGVMASDRRVKFDLREDPEAADAFIRSLSPQTFARTPGGPGELGVVAQQVERAPGGESIVGRTAEGLRVLSVPKLAGGLAASVGRIGERLEGIETALRGAHEKETEQRRRVAEKRRGTSAELFGAAKAFRKGGQEFMARQTEEEAEQNRKAYNQGAEDVRRRMAKERASSEATLRMRRDREQREQQELEQRKKQEMERSRTLGWAYQRDREQRERKALEKSKMAVRQLSEMSGLFPSLLGR